MRKKDRPIQRTEETMRDANLIVIASEDRYAVKQYFEFFRSTRIQFKVLETRDGSSSPKDVLKRLEQYADDYLIGDGDQLWVVTDSDRWNKGSHLPNLIEVMKTCRGKNIGFSVNNPCFDFWLLLHFTDFPNEEELNCKKVGKLIRQAVGFFNKKNISRLPLSDDKIRDAIKRAKENYQAKEEIPEKPQVSVHLVLEDLLEKEIITFSKGD